MRPGAGSRAAPVAQEGPGIQVLRGRADSRHLLSPQLRGKPEAGVPARAKLHLQVVHRAASLTRAATSCLCRSCRPSPTGKGTARPRTCSVPGPEGGMAEGQDVNGALAQSWRGARRGHCCVTNGHSRERTCGDHSPLQDSVIPVHWSHPALSHWPTLLGNCVRGEPH